MTFCTLRNL